MMVKGEERKKKKKEEEEEEETATAATAEKRSKHMNHNEPSTFLKNLHIHNP